MGSGVERANGVLAVDDADRIPRTVVLLGRHLLPLGRGCTAPQRRHPWGL